MENHPPRAGATADEAAGPFADDAAGAVPDDAAGQAAPATPKAAPQAAPDASRNGLSSPDHIVELADALSLCADQIHERVMKEIRSYQGRPVPEKVQATSRALLDDEVLLRQRANSLYADAATFVVKGLGKPQAHLAKLTADAAEKIRRIGMIGEVTGLVGGLLALAGAVATGQPVPVLMALEKVEKHAKAASALAPKPAAPKPATPPAKAG